MTFRRSFVLSGVDGEQPAGSYRLVVEEEQIPGLSFSAFRRLETLLYLPSNPAPGVTCQVVSISPDEFAAVLALDAA